MRGILTREMEAKGVGADTALQVMVPPADTVFTFSNDNSDEPDSIKHGALVKTKADMEVLLLH